MVGGVLRGVKAGVVSAVMGRFSKVWKRKEGGFPRFGNWGAEEKEGDSLTTENTEDTEGEVWWVECCGG